MPVEYISRIRDLYLSLGYGAYKWTVNETPPPWQPLRKPLARCRLALLASGGVYVAGQKAFHYKDDTSFRAISSDVDIAELRATHFAYDLTDARRDPNAVFPLGTLRGLTQEGVIGALAGCAYSFMGGIYSARRVTEELAPVLVDALVREEADAALLVPV